MKESAVTAEIVPEKVLAQSAFAVAVLMSHFVVVKLVRVTAVVVRVMRWRLADVVVEQDATLSAEVVLEKVVDENVLAESVVIASIAIETLVIVDAVLIGVMLLTGVEVVTVAVDLVLVEVEA